MSRGPQAVPNEPFDVGAFTIEARIKLQALSFLMSQVRLVNSTDDEIFHGISWILDDIRHSLEEPSTKGGA